MRKAEGMQKVARKQAEAGKKQSGGRQAQSRSIGRQEACMRKAEGMHEKG
jgi:hypothetical protein